MEDAVALGQLYCIDAGCPNYDLECLRSKDIEVLVAAQGTSQKWLNYLKPLESFLPWTPTIDGEILTQQSLDAFRNGDYEDIPMIVGTVSEEVFMFIYLAVHEPISDTDYIGAMIAVFYEDADEVLEWYPPKPIFGDKRPALGVTGTDYVFIASTRNASNNFSQKNDLYLYQFSHILSNDIWGPNYTFCIGHVCHGSELPFVFHIDGYNFTAEEEELSLSMIDYWTNFARTSDPNQGQNPSTLIWPLYDSSSEGYMNFSTPNQVSSHLREDYCNFWDTVGYNWGWNDKK